MSIRCRRCIKTRIAERNIAIGAKNMYDAAVNTAKLTPNGVSNRRSQRFRVEEWPLFAASPEAHKDDHTRDRRIRTPQRGERVPLDLHYNQENRQVCRAENYHHPYLREKKRTTRCNHIEQRNRYIICCLIDVHDTVSPDVQLQWVRRQRPQNIKRRSSTEHEKRQHTPATFRVRLEQKYAQRQQERQKTLRIQHERRAHVVRHRRRENTVQAQPDKSFDELMNGE